MASRRIYFILGALFAGITLLGGRLLFGPIPWAAAEEGKPNIVITTTDVPASYANFCRVTGTPEEMILDFGLNMQPFAAQPGSIEVSNRIVMSYFTAKRMIAALQISIQRHEAAFGKIETNVKKRVKRPSP